MKINRRMAGIWVATAAVLGFAPQSEGGCPRDNLRLNEINFLPAAGQHQWVEVTNVGNDPVSAAGVEILSNGGSYSLPAELAEIPKGGMVVIHFDGAGPAGNDYSFDGDLSAVLHTEAGTVDVLGSPVGFCSLYRVTSAHSKETLLDFVAWGGEPGDAAKEAVGKGIWPDTYSALPTLGEAATRVAGPTSSVPQGGVIARPSSTAGWENLPETGATPGRANSVLALPSLFRPNQDAWLGGTPSMFLWSHTSSAKSFDLQVSSDSDFIKVVLDKAGLVDNTYNPLPAEALEQGNYWWRVRSTDSDGNKSDWSQAYMFKVGIEVQPAPTGEKKRATKAGAFQVAGRIADTRAAKNGLRGVTVVISDRSAPYTVRDTDTTDASGRYAVSVDTGQYHISATAANFSFSRSTGLDVNVSASISGLDIEATGASGIAAVTPLGAQKDTAMLVVKRSSYDRMCDKDNTNDQAWDAPHTNTHNGRNFQEGYYCWAVSSVMIARYYGGNLTRDEVVYHVKNLGYGSDNGAYPADEQKALRFALQATASQINYRISPKFTDAEIVAAIDAKRPVFYVTDGHVETLDAYEYRASATGEGELWCRFVNTDNHGTRGNGIDEYEHYGKKSWWRGAIPNNGLSGRNTDPRLYQHSDLDGINDFDEEERFPSNAAITDSDADEINDKNEIASWVFPRPVGKGDVTGRSFNVADVDNDGLAPEVDEDSDNGGVKDGDEDHLNHDGIFDSEEGDIFDLNDDKSLDLVFCIDSTGSMGDDIAAVKANAIAILNKIEVDFPNFRVAVVDYKDHPVDPYGDPGDYPFRDVLSFSTNKNVIISAINSLGASGGNDWPESVYSAVIHCVQNPPGGWREDPVTRKVIYMGDAPPQIPEPFTGYTLASVEAAASTGGVVWESRYAKPSRTKGEAKLSGPVSSIGILVGSDSSARAAFEDIARVMDGSLVSAASAADVPGAVVEALEAIKTDPIVVLEVNGDVGAKSITADASKTVDPKGCGIIKYEWDWEADGTYDEWSYTPTRIKSYAGGFNGRVRVRATSVMGAQGTDTFIILIPDFLDVTQYTDTTTLSSHLNRDTAALFATSFWATRRTL
jgi:hypothetical protein